MGVVVLKAFNAIGLLVNTIGISVKPMAAIDPCCMDEAMMPDTFKLICAIVLTLLIIFALTMKLFERFTHKAEDPDTAVTPFFAESWPRKYNSRFFPG